MGKMTFAGGVGTWRGISGGRGGRRGLVAAEETARVLHWGRGQNVKEGGVPARVFRARGKSWYPWRLRNSSYEDSYAIARGRTCFVRSIGRPRVTRWGLFLRRGVTTSTTSNFASVAYVKRRAVPAVVGQPAMSCQRDQTRLRKWSCWWWQRAEEKRAGRWRTTKEEE